MNCTVHTDVAATSYCRTCGKAMCEKCSHSVRGVVYCEDCIATRLHDTMPSAPPASGFVPGTAGAPVVVVRPPSPGLAAFLGLIPFGVGAFYNGQFVKGIVHALVFIGLCYAASSVGILGMLIPLWIFYMAFDAHQTAKAIATGQPLPDPLGLNRTFGEPLDVKNVPTGSLVLIGLGVLFLLNTMGLFHAYWIHRLWPLILIVIGVWLLVKRFSPPGGATGGM